MSPDETTPDEMTPAPLDRIAQSVAERFEGDRRLVTFDDLLTQFQQDPYPLVRNSEQYLRDAVLHHGSHSVPGIGEEVTRWRLFDGDQATGVAALIGQEEAQQAVIETIFAAAREGRLNRMLVLHGPNGSGKSSLVELLQWGLEVYSHEPGGALYALRWIFPKADVEGTGLGFGGTTRGTADSAASYALLEAEDVAARIVCELRCNPLFVVPDSERAAFLESALESSTERRTESFRHFINGNLCPRCKQVYEALLAAYKGDWQRVVRHVQVERVFVSRRYRIGAVVTQPQGTADAQMRILAGDSQMAGLPPFLRSLPLFEVMGDLPDANRGLLEFSDFLKRNLELSKYLLQTTEKGFVTVGNRLFELDVVFCASVNERHLHAFKQLPEFASFQARMSFVRVPYLRQLSQETSVYREICSEMSRSRHVAPHLAEYSALFAILTRLERPRVDDYEGDLRELVAGLTPLEKAWLYAEGRTPDRLDSSAANELRRLLPRIRDEHQRETQYEGLFGASVREMRAALIQAAVRDDRPCVSPSALREQLREMCADRSLYRFLQVEAEERYHDVSALLDDATRQLGLWILVDVQNAMQIVSEDEVDRRFDAYFQHLVAFVQNRTVLDPSTGSRVPADAHLLISIEKLLPIQQPIEEYRRELVSRIGAYAIDHPDQQPLDFAKLFPDLLRSLRRSFFEERREAVTDVQRHVLLYDTPGFEDLPSEAREVATRTVQNLTAEDGPGGGYCIWCAKDAVDFALLHLEVAESEGE